MYNFVSRKFDFRGRWSATPKNRGRSKKTQGRTAMKNGDGSLAVGSYPKEAVPPPPGVQSYCLTCYVEYTLISFKCINRTFCK